MTQLSLMFPLLRETLGQKCSLAVFLSSYLLPGVFMERRIALVAFYVWLGQLRPPETL